MGAHEAVMEGEPIAPAPDAASPTPPLAFAHVPALDGLRGAAVAAVLAYHADRFTGGYLGVDLFFVLSGYLITSLLLVEHARTGTIALRGFWGRRLRRLMPAFLALVAVVALYARYVARPVDVAGIRADGLATLAYVANWHDIVRGGSYWDISRAPSPLQHVWSLAVEEQFYLLWPLAVAGLARWRGDHLDRVVLRVAVVLAALSAAAFIVFHQVLDMSTTRVYEGTDTRAAALLGGVALAAWARLHPLRPGSWRREALGLAAVAVLGVLWATLDGEAGFLYRGGLPLASALAVVVVAACADQESPVLGRVFSLAPLRWLGAISYGLYLWHWPIYQAIDLRNGDFPGLGDRMLRGHEVLAAKLGLSLVAAVVSYVVVEMPVRRGFLKDRVGWPAALGGMAVSALVLVVATAGAVEVPAEGSQVSERAEVEVVGAPDVLFVGDSVAESLVRQVIQEPDRYGINPINKAYPGCSAVTQGRTVRNFVGREISPPPCFRDLDAELPDLRPDLVLLLIGSRPNDAIEVDGEFVRACEPAYDGAYREAMATLARRLGGTGAPVVIGTVAHSGAQALKVEGSEGRIECVDRVLGEVVAEVPGTFLLDLDGFVCPGGTCIEELDGDPIRTDGLHYDDGPGGEKVTDWAVAEMLSLTGLSRGSEAGTTTTTTG